MTQEDFGSKIVMKTQRGHQWPGSQASCSDKFALYQQSVQEPESNCRFYDRIFKQIYDRRPQLLREDFCGTAAVCCQWVKTHPAGVAHGYDLDQPTLDWGRKHNIAMLSPEEETRVKLVCQDVREVKGPKADLISAENFSYFIFVTRDELRSYFISARRNLAREGLLVLDIMGGAEVYEEQREEERKFGSFNYVWENHRFDPITNFCTYFIHFRFKDGSQLYRAFRYDWRQWSIPEVRELLLEAGFRRANVYWEGTGKNGQGNGVYRLCRSAESDPAWVSYIVGVK
jgi:hypothetical protein